MEPRYYLTGLLCLTTFFLFADQNLLSPNMSAIAEEFKFSPAEKDSKLGGEIAFGFFIVGGVVSVVVGGWADTANRCKLFMWIVLLGEIACLATYLVTTFEQLLLCRILTGISIGGCGPIVYSILGDSFPGSSRVYVSTIMGLSMSAGISCGQLLAGFMGTTYGWRSPFIVIAIPAILCGVLVFFTANEPKRGNYMGLDISKDEKNSTLAGQLNRPLMESDTDARNIILDQHSETIQLNKILDLLKTKTVALCYLQGIPGCVPWSIITVFMSDYLSTDRGLSINQATFVFSVFGIGGLFGQILGGFFGQYLYNKDKRLQCLFMGVSTLTAILPMLSILNTDFYPIEGIIEYCHSFYVSPDGCCDHF
jgi:MFS family permease